MKHKKLKSAARAARRIEAANKPKQRIHANASSLNVSTTEGKTPSFDCLAYTGGELVVAGWDMPIVVDIQGVEFAPSVVGNLAHDAEKIVGHVTEPIAAGGQITLKGLISGTGEAAAEVVGNAKNGFPWQASIEADPIEIETIEAGHTVQVNGQSFVGPIYVARKSVVYGFAFVARGADESTSVLVAASAARGARKIMGEFEKWVTETTGLDPAALTEDQKKMLMAKHAAITAAKPPEAQAPPAVAAAHHGSRFDLDGINEAHEFARADLEAVFAARADECGFIQPAELAKIRAEATQTVNQIKAAAINARSSRERFELEALKARNAIEAELIKAAMPGGPTIAVGRQAVSGNVIEAAFCLGRKIPNIEKRYSEQTLEAAHKAFPRGIRLGQVILAAAMQNGYQCHPGETITAGNIRSVLRAAFAPIHAAGFQSVDLSGILSNVANKDLLDGYMEQDQTWREISKVKAVSDFKTHTSYRLLDSMAYELVGPGGEIKQGTVSEESYTRKARTYAKMLTLTREDIINDDLGAFDDARTNLGGGAAQKFNSVFWTAFMNNSSFFTSGRANYITGSTTNLGTDGVGLGLAVKAFRELRSPSADGSKRLGNVIGGQPTKILVPPALEQIADALYANRNFGAVATSSANTHAGKYRPVVVPQLGDSSITGYSDTAFYLLRDPGTFPAMVVSFLDGIETPTIESADADFDTLGVQFRGYHDFGADLAEYVCGIKSKGAA